MKKKSARIKCIFVTGILLVLLVVFGILWYDFYDITGLKMYKDEPIQDIYVFGSSLYSNALIVTMDGRGYMTGHQGQSENRKYRNTESRGNKYLNTAAVELYDGCDGGIRQVLNRTSEAIMFITENDVLYMAWDFSPLYRIAEQVIYASCESYGASTVYTIATNGNVYAIDIKDTNAPKAALLWDGKATAIAAWNRRLFILTDNGDVCEWMFENAVLSTPVFTNVQDFTITNSSYGADQQTRIESALMSICKTDGTLYVCGTFSAPQRQNTTISYTLEEPLLIGENVRSFSATRMGCAMLHNDGSVTYFGLRTEGETVTNDVGFFTLPVERALSIHTADAAYICVKTEDSFYMWSEEEIFFDKYYLDSVRNLDRSIWNGEPLVLKTP